MSENLSGETHDCRKHLNTDPELTELSAATLQARHTCTKCGNVVLREFNHYQTYSTEHSNYYDNIEDEAVKLPDSIEPLLARIRETVDNAISIRYRDKGLNPGSHPNELYGESHLNTHRLASELDDSGLKPKVVFGGLSYDGVETPTSLEEAKRRELAHRWVVIEQDGERIHVDLAPVRAEDLASGETEPLITTERPDEYVLFENSLTDFSWQMAPSTFLSPTLYRQHAEKDS